MLVTRLVAAAMKPNWLVTRQKETLTSRNLTPSEHRLVRGDSRFKRHKRLLTQSAEPSKLAVRGSKTSRIGSNSSDYVKMPTTVAQKSKHSGTQLRYRQRSWLPKVRGTCRRHSRLNGTKPHTLPLFIYFVDGLNYRPRGAERIFVHHRRYPGSVVPRPGHLKLRREAVFRSTVLKPKKCNRAQGFGVESARHPIVAAPLPYCMRLKLALLMHGRVNLVIVGRISTREHLVHVKFGGLGLDYCSNYLCRSNVLHSTIIRRSPRLRRQIGDQRPHSRCVEQPWSN
jgi:hypothetical protein